MGGTGNATKVVQFDVIIPTSSIRIVPATLTFPPTQVNTTSAPLTTVITNYGKTPLTITIIVTSSQWMEINHCNGKVAAGQTCTLSPTFTPNAVGLILGTMTMADSDPTSPQIIALIGTGTGVLAIDRVALTGTDAVDYSFTSGCGTSLLAGKTCTVTVFFDPQATGSLPADLTFTDNAPTGGGTQNVSLSGSGSKAFWQSTSSATALDGKCPRSLSFFAPKAGQREDERRGRASGPAAWSAQQLLRTPKVYYECFDLAQNSDLWHKQSSFPGM
jgi:hypothetical protein